VFYGEPAGTIASVYAADANAYSEPLVTFDVAPTQELPRAPSGAVGIARDGFAKIDIEGVTIRPRGHVHQGAGYGGMRIFAERGGIIVHPAFAARSGVFRDVPAESEMHREQFEQRLRKSGRQFWVFCSFLSGFVVIAIVVFVVSGRVPGPFIFSGAPAAAGGRVAWLRARRARHAISLADASLGAEPIPMRMRLWWGAGYGSGPVAFASLVAEQANAESPPYTLAVLGVPPDFDPPSDIPVMVRGALNEARGITIHIGELVLWPAGDLRPAPNQE
jgi:hypothetical protein